MAAFTNIPETPTAEVLSMTIGKAAGTISSAAIKTIDQIQKQLDDICARISQGDTSAYAELEKIENTIASIEKSLDALDAMLAALEATLKIIKLPIKAVKIALMVLKLVPLPIPAGVVITLIMLSELIAQIEQIIVSLRATISSIRSIFKPIREMLERLKKMINSLKLSKAVDIILGNEVTGTGSGTGRRNLGLSVPDTDTISDNSQNTPPNSNDSLLSNKDTQTLIDLNIITEDGNNIFNSLLPAINSTSDTILGFGKLNEIDFNSTQVQNLIRSAAVGDIVNISVDNSGDSLVDIFIQSSDKPLKPLDTAVPPRGWSVDIPISGNNWWVSTGTVFGTNGKVKSWSEPVRYIPTVTDIEDNSLRDNSDEKNKFKYKRIKVISRLNDLSNKDSVDGTALIVSGSDQAYDIVLEMIDRLDKSSIDQNIKDRFRNIVNDFTTNAAETVSDVENLSSDTYVSSNGDIYALQVVIDPKSPRIAPLHYVEVTDESGTVIYVGTKSFATKNETLLEETKVRLMQLLG